MSRYFTTLFAFLLLGAAVLSSPNNLSAQEAECPIVVGAVGGSAMRKGTILTGGTTLVKGDTVTTGDGSFLELNLGGALLKTGPRTSIVVDVSFCPDESSRAVRVKLLSGSIWAQGSPGAPKFDIATERFLATVGTATMSINARYLDTMFTIAQESQAVETRDWKDTVDVLHYTFPHKGHIATVFSLAGNVTIVPWGGRGAILKQGNQATYGFEESFISSKPVPLKGNEILFDPTGNYLFK